MKKTVSVFLVFLLLIGGVLAFPSETTLGDDRRTPGGTTFTIAGQERECSEYADKTGTFTGTKAVSSPVMPALINLYSCKNNDPQCDQGWTYQGEYEAPRTFSFPGKYMAYEIYYCPETSSECSAGETRPVTETSYQTCKGDGTWGATQSCGALQYYDPEEASCVVKLCQEAWTCTAWGDCTSGGNQYRSCNDKNRCGSYKDTPKTQQTCTPTASDGPTSVSEWKKNPPLVIVGAPTVEGNTYNPKAGDTIIVRQQFQVNTAGSYWIEAGLDQTRTFAIADVTKNTCDPEETWYKNEKESFASTGMVEKTFALVVPNNGEFVLHSAIVTGCAGEVLDQQNQVERIIAGGPKDDKSGNTGAWIAGIVLFVVSAAVVGGLIGLGVWAFKKR